MAETRWKPIVFTATVIVALTLILFLFVHKSSMKNRLCPNSEDLLYIDEQSGNGTCYRARTQGPCSTNMILLEVPANESVGVCDCDNLHNERILAYDPESNQCYFIFTQAYCKSDEWLKLTKDGSKCEKNVCLIASPTSPEWVELSDGSCAQLGKPHESCKNSEDVIKFFQYKVYPACNYSRKPSNPVHIGNIGVPPVRCPPGYSRTRLGHCALDFDFE